MFRLDNILKQLLKFVSTIFKMMGWLGKESDAQKAFQDIKQEVERRHPYKRRPEWDQVEADQKWLYYAGYGLMIVMLVLTLVLFVFQGSFYREWINPYSPTGQATLQALHPNQLAVALFGTVGIPPFVIFVSLVMFLVGWFLMFCGLQTAHPSYILTFGAVFTGQMWLLSSGHPLLQSWLPFASGAIHLGLCTLGYGNKHHAPFHRSLRILHFYFLALAGYFLLSLSPSRMGLMIGLSAAQISTIVMLVIYWYLLGRDAMDGSVVLGQWYGFFSLRFLRSTTIALVTLGLLLLGSIPYLRHETFLLPFGIVVLFGCGLLIVQWARTKTPPTLFAINLFLLSLLLLVIAPRAMSAYLSAEIQAITWFGIFSPIMLYIYSTVWSFYSSGPLFINRATDQLPVAARMFLHIGWVQLATNCLLFFVAARDNLFTTLSFQITAEAFLIVGIPFFLYLLYRSWRQILIDKTPTFAQDTNTATTSPESIESTASTGSIGPTESTESTGPTGSIASTESTASSGSTGSTDSSEPLRPKWYIPGYVFVGMSVLLLLSVYWVRGLSFVTYSQVAYHTARGNIALRQNRYNDAIESYEKAQRVSPHNEKPYVLKAVAYEALGRKGEALEALGHATRLRPEAVDSWLLQGALLRQKHEHAKALQSYEKARQLDPSDSFTYRNIGLCYSYMGQHSLAMQYMRQALALMPGTNEFGNTHYAALGLLHMRANQFREAERALQKALSLNKGDFLAHSDLGILYQTQKPPRLQLAHHHLQQAVRLRPDRAELLGQLSSITETLVRKHPQQRVAWLRVLFEEYERSLQKSPDHEKIISQYIDNTLHFEAFTQAERVLVMLRKQSKRKHLLLVLEANIAMRQGHYKPAHRYLDELLTRYPNHRQGLYFRGQLHQMEKNYRQALVLYQRVLQQDPSHEMALLNTVIAHRILGQVTQAIAACRNLLHHHPRHAKGRFEMALLHQTQKRYPQALQIYRQLLSEQADHTDALRNVAVTLNVTKQCHLALPYYARYFKSTTQPASIMNYSWANCHYQLRQYEKAIPLYQRYVQAEPQRWFAYYFLALSHQMLRQYTQALSAYQKVLSLRPKDYSSMLNMAKIYRFTGQFQAAQSITHGMLQGYPKDRNARLELVFQAQFQKQYKEAIRILQTILPDHPKDGALWGQLAFLFSQNRDYPRAYQASLQWLRVQPTSDDAWSGVIAYETYQLRQFANVSRRCQTWIHLPHRERHPRYVSILYTCGWAAQQQPTEQASAVSYYQRILHTTQNRSTYAAIYLADLYRRQSRPQQQIHYLRLATQAWPQNMLFRLNWALALQKNKQISEADVLFRELQSVVAKTTPNDYARWLGKTRGLPLIRPALPALQQYLTRWTNPAQSRPSR